MTVFPFPPEAVEKNEPFSVTGFDWASGARADALPATPPADAQGDFAPAFDGLIAPDGEAPVILEAFSPGQTLRTHLTQAVAAYGARVWLHLSPLRRLYRLPSPEGRFETPDGAALQAYLAAHPARFCPEFVCLCAHWAEDGQLFVLLFDTADTIDRKLSLAAALGVAQVFGQMQIGG